MSDNATPHDMSAAPHAGEVPPAGVSWQEQDGTLRDLWLQNKTPQEIGEVLGRSVPAIMTRAARLGLPRRAAPGRKPGAGSTRRLPSSFETGNVTKDNRRSMSAGHAGESAETAPQPSSRICLMCLRKFESAGRHNRICMPCKGTAEYAQASALPDIHLPNN